jgi:abhydrolase domain-containing protein 6
MKKLLLALFLLFAALAVWTAWSYPLIGELVYKAGAYTEARFFGLKKQPVDIGETSLITYQGGPQNGTAVVMLHGYTADKDVWPRFARHIIDNYRVIVPDLAGHGDTEFNPKWDYSIPAQSECVIKMMDASGIEKAHVIGNSMGGHIAAYLAIHYPQRILSAALIDPAGVDSPVRSEMDDLIEQGDNPFLFDTQKGFSRLYPMTMAQPPWLPGFVLDAIADKYIERRPRHAQIFKDIDTALDELNGLTVPTLLVWGDQDRLLDVSATKVWAAKVPHLQVVVMPGIGHMPMLETPEETAEIYQQFLNGLETPASRTDG